MSAKISFQISISRYCTVLFANKSKFDLRTCYYIQIKILHRKEDNLMKPNRKNKTIKIRINEHEKEILKKIAASENLTLSAYAMKRIMCEDSIYIKEIPNVVKTWEILNTLCCEIEQSTDKHLKTFMYQLMREAAK